MSLEMKYFVLKPRAKSKDDVYAMASQNAVFAYASIIEKINPELAKELELWANREVWLQNAKEGK